MRTSSFVSLASVALMATFLPGSATAQHSHGSHGDMPHPSEHAKEEQPRPPPEPLPARTIEIRVTEKGFEPERVVASVGERIKLVVTRITDATCAREVVLDEFLILDPLPLGRPFTTTFTTGRPGNFTYHCARGTVQGTFTVEDAPTKRP